MTNRLISSDIYQHSCYTLSEDTQPTCSELNSYVPFYSLFTGTTMNKNNRKVLNYNLVGSVDDAYMSNGYTDTRYQNMIDTMRVRLGLRRVCTTRNRDKTYIALKGFLGYLDTNLNIIPFVVLTVKSDSIFKLKKEELDLTKFCLIINSSLINPDHMVMYKNLKKLYIDPIIAMGVDVLYTNDIKKQCYNKFDYIPKFKTIAEMNEHLKTINNLIFD
jgi:hypothetical protein